jgi:tRNA (guanine37-N1)-methyltransferase
MQIGLVTLFPEMFSAVAEHGISGRAIRSKLVSLNFWNPRNFSRDKYRTVDDKPFGGGPGMLMKTEPLVASIQAAKASLSKAKVAYLSPQGAVLTQNRVVELASEDSLILVCGRYQGIDARLMR